MSRKENDDMTDYVTNALKRVDEVLAQLDPPATPEELRHIYHAAFTGGGIVLRCTAGRLEGMSTSAPRRPTADDVSPGPGARIEVREGGELRFYNWNFHLNGVSPLAAIEWVRRRALELEAETIARINPPPEVGSFTGGVFQPDLSANSSAGRD